MVIGNNGKETLMHSVTKRLWGLGAQGTLWSAVLSAFCPRLLLFSGKWLLTTKCPLFQSDTQKAQCTALQDSDIYYLFGASPLPSATTYHNVQGDQEGGKS